MALQLGWPQVAWLALFIFVHAANALAAKTPEQGCFNAFAGMLWFAVQFLLLYCGGFFG
jgi:hypothetical protein